VLGKAVDVTNFVLSLFCHCCHCHHHVNAVCKKKNLIIENIQIICFADRDGLMCFSFPLPSLFLPSLANCPHVDTVCKKNNLNILNNQFFFFADRVGLVLFTFSLLSLSLPCLVPSIRESIQCCH
jgi:hypothetical protein